MKYIFSIILFLLFILPLKPEKVVIKGKAPHYKKEKVSLLRYTDYITYTEKVLKSAHVSEDGRFKFELECDTIYPAFLRINGINTKLFLQPGSKYNVRFPKVRATESNILKKTKEASLIFNKLPQKDINWLITDFHDQYDRFFVKNYKAIASQTGKGGGGYERNLKEKKGMKISKDSSKKRTNDQVTSLKILVDSFRNKLKKRYGKYENNYFDQHMRYAFTSLERVITGNRKELYKKYLKDEPIQYNNEEYMKFFNKFYDDILPSVYRKVNEEALYNAVELDSNYSKMMLYLSKAPYLEKKNLRELVFLKAAPDLYHKDYYNENNILIMLDSLKEKTDIKKHKEIARNTIAMLNHLEEGTKAPGFKLMDLSDSTTVKLEEVLNEGKPIYLNFWSSWSKSSIKEMKVLADFQDKYEQYVKFVSVSLDENIKKTQRVLQEHPEFDWTILYGGNNYNIKDVYSVYDVPKFFFIDKNGEFIRSPGYKPSGRAEADFKKIRQKVKDKRKKERIDMDK